MPLHPLGYVLGERLMLKVSKGGPSCPIPAALPLQALATNRTTPAELDVPQNVG